ncbi:MAG: hypothetical protein WCC18_19095 [Candidatus Acidiferrales bacterium]
MTAFTDWKKGLEDRCAAHCAAAVADEPVTETRTPERKSAHSGHVATAVMENDGQPGHSRGALCVGITDLGAWGNAKIFMMRVYWKFPNGKMGVEDVVQTLQPGTRLNKIIRLLGLEPKSPFESTSMIGRRTSRRMPASELGDLLPIAVEAPQFTQPHKLVK